MSALSIFVNSHNTISVALTYLWWYLINVKNWSTAKGDREQDSGRAPAVKVILTGHRESDSGGTGNV